MIRIGDSVELIFLGAVVCPVPSAYLAIVFNIGVLVSYCFDGKKKRIGYEDDKGRVVISLSWVR